MKKFFKQTAVKLLYMLVGSGLTVLALDYYLTPVYKKEKLELVFNSSFNTCFYTAVVGAGADELTASIFCLQLATDVTKDYESTQEEK